MFKVHVGSSYRRFDSLEDAKRFCESVFQARNIVLSIVETKRRTMKPFADVTTQSAPERIHAAITSALTAYDMKQSKRKFYNPYALPQYLGAFQSAQERVASGSTWRVALVSSFTGRLLDVVLKSIGEPESTDAEQRF